MLKELLASVFLMVFLAAGCGGSGTAVSTEPSPYPEETTPWDYVTVTGSVVNLRAGPGTEYSVLDQVVLGDSLRVAGGVEDWYRVYVSDRSLFAWIYAPLTSGTDLP
jgi:SH3-like domain-containing protein